jgi:hypothetical protein
MAQYDMELKKKPTYRYCWIKPVPKTTKRASNPRSEDKKRLPSEGEASLAEKWADDIMSSVLGLNQAELADVYRSQTEDDPTQNCTISLPSGTPLD